MDRSAQFRVSCCGPQENRPETQFHGKQKPAGTVTDTPISRLPWVIGSLGTGTGDVPLVATTLRAADRLGTGEARWVLGRMHYSVEPGLYAVGRPTPYSPALVSANYKMSFDRLRSQLGGLDAWILVLDTRGINVWCAAGKGTFGTEEIIRRIQATGLAGGVSHRTLIVPQLGAPGGAAHQVTKRSGF